LPTFSPASGIGVWLISWALSPLNEIITASTSSAHPKIFISSHHTAAMSDNFREGNIITFAEPGDLANSKGNGSIDTVAFSSHIIVRPLNRVSGIGPNHDAGTHGMFVLGNEGKYFKVADMWLKTSEDPDFTHFKFTANAPGFNAAGIVYRRSEGEWEIVFRAAAKCGACGVACGSCSSKR
jgi:hypothetical protein